MSQEKVCIELLALDLDTCTRCSQTQLNIEKALDIIKPVLKVTEREVEFNRIIIKSEEQALNWKFSSSPTIRINGDELIMETLESPCESCSDLCGCEEEIDCRVWYYKGTEYEEAPVGLIVEMLLREIYGSSIQAVKPVYPGVPENLKRFFAAMKKQEKTKACCSPEEQQNCCPPGKKSFCCDPDA